MILLLTIPHEQESRFDTDRPYKERNEVKHKWTASNFRYLGERALCTSTHKEHYEQKSIMYSTSIKSSETEHFTLFHCA